MRLLSKSFAYIAFWALVLGLPEVILAQEGQPTDQPSVTAQPAATAAAPPATNIASSELPDSPGASRANAQDASIPQDSSSQQGASNSTQPGAGPAADGPGQDPKLQRPVGTAAAEAPTVNGVTAAQPSGVAIAPAKQHRVRTIVLKVGAIVGAGAALGTVVALTAATSSKPPGAH